MPITIEPSALYTEQEWAAMSGIATSTLRRKRIDGTGPEFVKFGRRVFYAGTALIQHVETATRRSTSGRRRDMQTLTRGLAP